MRDTVALDTSVFLRHAVRRMLCGLQEVRGGSVLVPNEAMREARKLYHAIAGRHGREVAKHEARKTWGPRLPPEAQTWRNEQGRKIGQITAAAFMEWTEEEPRRNDRAWYTGGVEERALETAIALGESGGFEDPPGTGDPLVVAQALLGGAQVVSTGNMRSLDRARVNAWVEEYGREYGGVEPHAPFLVTPDEAWRERIAGRTRDEREWETVRLAYSLCRPEEERAPGRTLQILSHFERQLERGGLPLAAEAIRAERKSWRGREAEMLEALKGEMLDVARTRGSEQRRIDRERGGRGAAPDEEGHHRAAR